MTQWPSKLSHQHKRSAYFPDEKNSEGYRRKNNGPNTRPCGTPDTTLTSSLRQPSTMMCCDRFDRNCVNMDNTELQYPQSRADEECPDGWLHWNEGCTEMNLRDPRLLSTLQCILQWMVHTQKCITATQAFLISKLGGWYTTLRPINRLRRTDTSAQTPLTILML